MVHLNSLIAHLNPLSSSVASNAGLSPLHLSSSTVLLPCGAIHWLHHCPQAALVPNTQNLEGRPTNWLL